MNAPQPTTQTPEAQAAQAHAKAVYVQGTYARVIAKLNGSAPTLLKIKNLNEDVKKEAIFVGANMGKKLEDLKFRIPPITAEINHVVDQIQKDLGFLSDARSKLAPILTEQANKLFNENTDLQHKCTELENDVDKLVKNIDELYAKAAKGDITPQKLLEELKTIAAKSPPIKERVENLEATQNAMLNALEQFQGLSDMQTRTLRVEQALSPTGKHTL